MAYKLHYEIKRTRNEGTEEEPNIVETLHPASVDATDADYDTQMAFAKAEAYNGEVTVEEVPDPETPITPTGESSIWTELNRAYQEGVDSV